MRMADMSQLFIAMKHELKATKCLMIFEEVKFEKY